jgi:hypothetical protein
LSFNHSTFVTREVSNEVNSKLTARTTGTWR